MGVRPSARRGGGRLPEPNEIGQLSDLGVIPHPVSEGGRDFCVRGGSFSHKQTTTSRPVPHRPEVEWSVTKARP
jgi:hypothetical protein